MIDLPDFKDMVLTVCKCSQCGHLTNSIKADPSEKGNKFTLQVICHNDMQRELIKSGTCSVLVPELDLELTPGTLGTQFTTVEGLLRLMLQDLQQNVMQIMGGSGATDDSSPFGQFMLRLQKVVNGEENFTLVMDDPVSNCVSIFFLSICNYLITLVH